MGKLDTPWAIDQIDHFLKVTQQIVPNMGPGVAYLGTVMRGPETEAAGQAHIVEQILDRVLPGWQRGQPTKDKDYSWLREQASRGRTALQRSAELAERLGDNAPGMDAANLHSWAWDAARSLWNSGHYHQAVLQAAMNINAQTQGKLGRFDISETNLFNQAFTLDAAKAGAPRLRIVEDDGSPTYENLHRGARAFAEGLYSGIRNPGMHVPHAGGGDQQLALEQLAAFSLLARWVDQASVEHA